MPIASSQNIFHVIEAIVLTSDLSADPTDPTSSPRPTHKRRIRKAFASLFDIFRLDAYAPLI